MLRKEKRKKEEGNDEVLLSGAELIRPYKKRGSKGEEVEEMFDSIAPAYDFMNTAMTLGMHRNWRNRALKAAEKRLPNPRLILDIATGTGDVAFKLAEKYQDAKVTGVDLSRKMLEVADEKLSRLPEEMKKRIRFSLGDSMVLEFGNATFDMITVAYGVRNFELLRQGLAEMYRVLSPGGLLCIIELSVPVNPILKAGYNLYSRHIIPFVGRMVSGDTRAYSYLPESIAAAPQREEMAMILRECGFSDIKWKSLTFGVVTYYLASK